MKSGIILFIAAIMLLSACSGAEGFASVSLSSSTPSISSSEEPAHSSCEPPELDEAPSGDLSLPEYIPLKDLPKNYPSEEALKDGVIVLVHGEYEGTSYQLIPVFLRQVSEGKTAKLRIKQYTIEGDPIYSDLEYLPDKNCYILTTDSSRDAFSAFKTIYSRKYAYLWVLPPQTEDPNRYNPNTYLTLSQWKNESGTPEDCYHYSLLPIPENITEETAELSERIQNQNSDKAVQRIFTEGAAMEAQLLEDGSITVYAEGQHTDISEAMIIDNPGESFDRLEWNEENLLVLKNGDSIVRIFDPAAQDFTPATCIGLPLAPTE